MAVTITYNLAPIPRWLFTDLVGLPLSDGTMYAYDDLDRVINKTVYKDPEGTIPWSQPVSFELNGMPDGSFYWASGSNYYLAFFDHNNVPQFTVGQYPFGVIDAPTPFPTNFVRNAQFSYWTNTTNFPSLGYSLINADYIADEWLFARSNTASTINISKGIFGLGQTDVPFFPVNYLHYECTNAGGGGEIYKNVNQVYQSVQTLSGQEVCVSIWAKGTAPIAVNIYQSFGTGGFPSASTTTNVFTTALTASWQQYTGIVTIPTVIGKSLGTNNDDELILAVELPLNQVGSVDISSVQFQVGHNIPEFPYITVDDQQKLLNKLSAGIPTTGDFKHTLSLTPQPGWVLCDNGTIGNQFSNATNAAGLEAKALFTLIWNGVSNAYAPLYNSAGMGIARGISAEADFQANNKIALLQTLDNVLGQYNNGSGHFIGYYAGNYLPTLTLPQMPAHNHTLTDPGHQHQISAYGPPPNANEPGFTRGAAPFIGIIDTVASTTGITLAPAGGTDPYSTMQPMVFVNLMLKL